MLRGIISFSILGLILGGCALFGTEQPPTAGMPCTQEAKICPDGTTVGRTEPNCNFAPCPRAGKDIPATRRLNARDVEGVAQAFSFSTEIPQGWRVAAVPTLEALNIFDPNAPGENDLERSQIFIRYFEANSFLTLSTVTIFTRHETIVAGRPAVIYDIAKKEGVPDFPHQPSWRNARHTVTDVRERDENPSVFYVFAKHPELPDEVFQAFLKSLQFTDGEVGVIVEPVAEFRERITKKSFGIYITPQTSPVPDERFTGYHTGVDVEYEDVSGDVSVRAITQGEIVLSRWADGYGGVVAIKHTVDGARYLGIYGHLDPASLPKMGATINKGERVGILGDGKTSETDGARKHLHFSLFNGDRVDIRGYVTNKEELNLWVDPLAFFMLE